MWKLPHRNRIRTYSCLISKALLLWNLSECCCSVASVVSDSLQPMDCSPTRLLCPWDSPGKNTGVGCCALLHGIFPTQESNPYLQHLLHCRQFISPLTTCSQDAIVNVCLWGEIIDTQGWNGMTVKPNIHLLLLLLSCFSCVQLCATPEPAAHQAPPSLGFSRQEHWSGLPSPSPMHESEK